MLTGYKTFLGLLISALGTLMTANGYDAKVIDEGVGASLALIDDLFTYGGLVFAALGRFVATTKMFSKEMN